MKKLRELLEAKDRSNYVEKLPTDVYEEVASQFPQFEPEDIAAIGGVESTHGKFNKPLKGGSATGLFQFKPETAEGLIPGSSENLDDMNIQEALMKAYLSKNKAENIEDAYAMHNLGKRGGSRFLEAPDESNIEDIMTKRTMKANPIYKGTVGSSKDKIKDKLEKASKDAEYSQFHKFKKLFKERE